MVQGYSKKSSWSPIDDTPVTNHEEKCKTRNQPQLVSQRRHAKPVLIWIDIRISNELHLSQKNLSY